MNTESDIFSSPKSRDVNAAQVLTERLYPEKQGDDPYISTRSSQSTLEELQRLAMSYKPLEQTEQGLEQKIKSFQKTQSDQIDRYLKERKRGIERDNFLLFYLHGWQSPLAFTLTEQSRKSSGGIFLRWNGKGIAINPGTHFLKNFHAKGLNIRDIDFVIVTGETGEIYEDVKEIYDLNYQLNRLSPDLHIIHYYFSLKAFQELSKILKPHFKQERNNLHSLEIFMDSPEVEKVELAEGIWLHYFLTAMKDNKTEVIPSTLGIRLDLKAEDYQTMRIGYISNAGWNPLLAHYLGSCDLLITGFGNTSLSDCNKLSYNIDSLGYYGTATLLEEVAPKLFLSGEFGGREGDIRIEAIQKLRKEWKASSKMGSPAILPADKGLQICLKTLRVKCSVSDEWIESDKICIAKSSQTYGSVKYLAPSCYC